MNKLIALIACLVSITAHADGGLILEFTGSGVPTEAAKLIGESRGASLTAAGNSSQANAYAIVNTVNTFTTVTDSSADSARLPAKSIIGRDDFVIINQGAGTLKVYPPTGGKINNLSTNGGFNVGTGGAAHFKRISSIGWFAIGVSVPQDLATSSSCMGVATPNGNTNVAVTTSCATTGSRVFYSRVGAITNMGAVSTTVAPSGTGFSFASTGATDTLASSVVYLIVK